MDMELVGRVALFHDLGKAKTHAIDYGRIGADLGQALEFPANITEIMEKHICCGLNAAEAVGSQAFRSRITLSGIPRERYRLVDIITDGIVELRDEMEAEERFE